MAFHCWILEKLSFLSCFPVSSPPGALRWPAVFYEDEEPRALVYRRLANRALRSRALLAYGKVSFPGPLRSRPTVHRALASLNATPESFSTFESPQSRIVNLSADCFSTRVWTQQVISS